MPRLELTVARGSTPAGRSGFRIHCTGLTSATRLMREARDARLSITQTIRHCKFQGVNETVPGTVSLSYLLCGHSFTIGDYFHAIKYPVGAAQSN